MAKFCYVCNLSSDTRPYGEDGKDICFDCAQKPEYKEGVDRRLTAYINSLKGDTLVFHNDKPPTDNPDDADKGVAVLVKV